MSEVPEKVIERLQKILALARNNPSVEEAKTAMAMAHKLLAKHNLSLAEIERRSASGKAEVPREGASMKGEKRTHITTIAQAVAKLHMCVYFIVQYRTVRGALDSKVDHVFVGRDVNTQAALAMFEFICHCVSTAAKRYCAEAKARQGAAYDRTSTYRSFCRGAAYEIYRRASELVEASKKDVADGMDRHNALVCLEDVYAAEEAANKQALARVAPDLRQSKGNSSLGSRDDYRARKKGEEYGRTVPLSPQVEGGAKGKLTHG